MTGMQGSTPPDGGAPRSVLGASRGLAPGARFEAWQAHIGPFFDVDRPEGPALDRFGAQLEVGLLGDVMTGRCQASAQGFERSELKVARDAHDHLMIQVFRSGGTRARVGGRELSAGPGDIWVIDMLEPMASETSDFANVSIVAPRALVAGGLRDPDAHHLRRIGGDQPIARLFSAYLDTLVGALGELSAAEATQLVPATLRLTEALLNAAPGAERAGIDRREGDRALLLAGRRLIEARLADPELTPEALARALGLSRARLYRVFAPVGGVAAYIRARRLKRSLADLLDPAQAHRPIYEIAFAWRFGSESDFSRAFRRRFGLSPRDARQARLARPAQSGEAGLAHERWLAELSR